jgi:D-glycero-D-manno-heptose 1,7-bisphosphate phosphatase
MKQFDTLFLDRDGILNKKIENGYVLDFSQIEIIPGIKEFLQIAANHFSRIIVVTNQRCVGLDLLAADKLLDINNTINHLTGSLVDRFYVCPHLNEDNCSCRKPKTGLFLNAQKDYNIDFIRSWMIGDSETDMIPAKQLQIFTLFLYDQRSSYADRNFKSFGELLPILQE